MNNENDKNTKIKNKMTVKNQEIENIIKWFMRIKTKSTKYN